MASKEAWGGYILEEILAYLIRRAGYKLLTDPKQDRRELIRRGAGLAVIGRGGRHQADVLGQLGWIPPFTFPMRLFVEAKYRSQKVKIQEIRNALGIIEDINQNSYPLRENKILLKRYHYSYALFSTSGFSADASKMALAHQISLVDLSGPDFIKLRNEISETAENLVHTINSYENQSDFGETIDEKKEYISPNYRAVVNVRNFMRRSFGTAIPRYVNRKHILSNILDPIIRLTMYEYGELFVAMVEGPFMLLLKADNPCAFLEYCKVHPNHDVLITWSESIDEGGTWLIQPTLGPNEYILSFRIPNLLFKWIFEPGSNIRRRALNVKEQYLSSLFIYRIDEHGEHHIFKLNYDKESTIRHINEINRWRNR
jgi:hypothetical protein